MRHERRHCKVRAVLEKLIASQVLQQLLVAYAQIPDSVLKRTDFGTKYRDNFEGTSVANSVELEGYLTDSDYESENEKGPYEIYTFVTLIK